MEANYIRNNLFFLLFYYSVTHPGGQDYTFDEFSDLVELRASDTFSEVIISWNVPNVPQPMISQISNINQTDFETWREQKRSRLKIDRISKKDLIEVFHAILSDIKVTPWSKQDTRNYILNAIQP